MRYSTSSASSAFRQCSTRLIHNINTTLLFFWTFALLQATPAHSYLPKVYYLDMDLQLDTMTTATEGFDPYKSSRFVGYSLWMVPSGATLNVYDDIVGATALELDTFHFLPHITLVAALTQRPVEEIVERTRHLASLLTPYEFELDDLSQKDAYFQCVFATMKKTQQVIHANQVARQVFVEKQEDAPYMPHLSMVYGDFSSERKTNDLIPHLREQLHARAPETLTIPVDAIEIWCTEGDVKDWYFVERVNLNGVKTLEGPEDANNDHLERAQ